MARDLDGVLQAHQQQLRDESPWVWLYGFQVPTDPPTRYRLTNYTEPVEFGTNPTTGDPIVYSPYPIEHGDVELSRSGDLPSITVSIGIANREVAETIESNAGLLGQPAVVRLVNVAAILSGAQIRFDAQIARVRMTHEIASVELAAMNVRQARFPRRRYMRHHCQFQFGDEECGYLIPLSAGNSIGSGFDFCPKRLKDCQDRGDDEVARGITRGHPDRFGGFLGVGGSR